LISKNLPYKAFRQLPIPRIAPASTSLSPRPSVPSMARQQGYKLPPRGGRGRCRRTCERTPVMGRSRCAAGGRYPAYCV
jgi:hypothetical protein